MVYLDGLMIIDTMAGMEKCMKMHRYRQGTCLDAPAAAHAWRVPTHTLHYTTYVHMHAHVYMRTFRPARAAVIVPC